MLAPLRDDRKLALAPGAARRARARDRTRAAARRGLAARGRAELHQALVEIAGCRRRGQGRHQLAGASPQLALTARRLDVVGDRVDPRQHARDVAVDEGRALAERDRRDRTRGVRADARDRAQLGGASRQSGAKRLRAGVEVARARVVAQARPRGEHVVERRGRERAERRERGHPAPPVRHDGLDPRLLQHDLADPDRVRITRAPPRQVATNALEMRDDGGRDLYSGRHARTVSVAPGDSFAVGINASLLRRTRCRSIRLNCTSGSSRTLADPTAMRTRWSTTSYRPLRAPACPTSCRSAARSSLTG